MLHFKEKIYQICASIAGILFSVFGLINSAELRQSDLTNIYILFAVVYGCVILLSLLLVFIEKRQCGNSSPAFVFSCRLFFHVC